MRASRIFPFLFAAAAFFPGCALEPRSLELADAGHAGGPSDAAAAPDGGAGDAGGATDASYGTVEPDPSFFTPVAGDAVVVSFKGLINPYASVLDDSYTQGVGGATVLLGPASITVKETLRAFRYTFPDDYASEAYRGMTFHIVDFYTFREGTENHGVYDQVRLYVPEAALGAAKESGTSLLALPEDALINYDSYEVTVRADKTSLVKTCFLATADREGAASQLFVDHGSNITFGPGEDLKLWANVAMTTDAGKIIAANGEMELVGGVPCRFYRDAAVITAAQYAEELTKTFELDCPLPDGFPPAPAASQAALKFIGPLNDFADASAETANGAGEYVVSIDGEEMAVADYSAYAGRTAIWGRDYVAVVTLGSVTAVTEAKYTLLSTEMYIPLDTLAAIKAGGGNPAAFKDFNFGITVSRAEEKLQGADHYAVKQCPLAVVDKAAAQSALFASAASNDVFAAGEELQVAASIALTTDAAAIAEYTGSADACYCYADTGALTCAAYDAL